MQVKEVAIEEWGFGRQPVVWVWKRVITSFKTELENLDFFYDAYFFW